MPQIAVIDDIEDNIAYDYIFNKDECFIGERPGPEKRYSLGDNMLYHAASNLWFRRDNLDMPLAPDNIAAAISYVCDFQLNIARVSKTIEIAVRSAELRMPTTLKSIDNAMKRENLSGFAITEALKALHQSGRESDIGKIILSHCDTIDTIVRDAVSYMQDMLSLQGKYLYGMDAHALKIYDNTRSKALQLIYNADLRNEYSMGIYAQFMEANKLQTEAMLRFKDIRRGELTRNTKR